MCKMEKFMHELMEMLSSYSIKFRPFYPLKKKKKKNHPFSTNIIWLYQHIILAPKKKKLYQKISN